MKPVFQLLANDTDITETIAAHFSSLDIKDSVGFESDTLGLVLEDVLEDVVWPSKGATLDAYLGFDGELYYKGRFIVDEVNHDGAPDQVSIHAKAADMIGMIKGKRSRDWSGMTTLAIVRAIAESHGLIPAVSEQLQGFVHQSLTQLDESDLHFLSRLARSQGAISKPKKGRLLFIEEGVATTAGGNEMPLLVIDRSECSPSSGHSYQERGRDEYDRVQAYYWVTEDFQQRYWDWYAQTYRTHTYQRRTLKVAYAGGGARTKTLAGRFNSEDEAIAAALAELNRVGRESSALSLSLSQGQPDLMAESRLEVTGFRKRINEQNWIVSEVSHTLDSSGGLSTTVQAKRPQLFIADNEKNTPTPAATPTYTPTTWAGPSTVPTGTTAGGGGSTGQTWAGPGMTPPNGTTAGGGGEGYSNQYEPWPGANRGEPFW